MSDLFDLLEEMDDSQESERIIKAPFAYPGSKFRSIKYILPHLPETKKYVEVFGGSGAILLARKKSKLEVFNDAFSGVTDFYRCIKDKTLCDRLCDWLDLTICSEEEFYHCKATWQDLTDPVERAARWYYSVTYSFGSLGRNYGRAIEPNAILAGRVRTKLDHFWPVHERLKNVQIENRDWLQVMRDHDSYETVFYLDPPYLDSDSGVYKKGFGAGFKGEQMHKRLLDTIFATKGFVALSGYDTPIYESPLWDDKLKWDAFVSIKSINGKGNNKDAFHDVEKRFHAEECLWIKYAGNV